MDIIYLIILDYSIGELIKIKLNQKQREECEKYDDFEEFLYTLEEEYDFRVKDCSWMVTETLQERSYL